MSSAPAIGIDLGNSLCRVAVFRNGQVEIIANDQGDTAIPTYVAFTTNGRLIGEEAKNHLCEDPENTVYDFKYLIGMKKEENPDLQENINNWPFNVVNDHSKSKVQITYRKQKKTLYPEQILAMIIGRLKDIAEDYLGCLVKEAVFSIPSHFTFSQRQSIYSACCITGLNVLRFVSDSLLVAVSYGLFKKPEIENVLIFNFGSSSLSISIVKMENGILEEISTTGDTTFGGRDFDYRILSFLSFEFHQMRDKDISNDNKAVMKLLKECDNAKCILSSYSEARVDIESLFEDTAFHTTITRSCFEELCEDLFTKAMDMVKRCLKESKLEKTEIDSIVMTGGSSQMPKMQELLQNYFEGKEIVDSLDFDETVARGAAVFAAISLGHEPDTLQDINVQSSCPISLGIETDRDHRSITFPFHPNPVKSLMNAASDTLTAVGNRFAGAIVTQAAAKVASGAITAASSMVKETERIYGKMMTTFVKRNAALPTKHVKMCTTFCEEQTGVLIQIFEGECVLTKDNNIIGKLELNGIPPAPRGVPQIEVSFDLDASGMLTVSATEKETNRQNKIALGSNTNLFSKEEIDRMRFEIGKFKLDDKRVRDRTASKQLLESYCNSLKSVLQGDQFEENRKNILEACNKTLQWSTSSPLCQKDEYEQKKKEVEEVCRPVMMEFYQVVASSSSDEILSEISVGTLGGPSIIVPVGSRRSSTNVPVLSRKSSIITNRSFYATPRGSSIFPDCFGEPRANDDLYYINVLRKFSLSVSERCNMIRESCMETIAWLDENQFVLKTDVIKRQKEIEHMCSFLIPQT